MQLFKTIPDVCSKKNGEGHVKKKFLSNCRSAIQVSYVAVSQWLEILINGFPIKKVLTVGGWWWVLMDIFRLVVGGGGYVLAGGGWWCVVVDKFWLVVDDGGYILAGGGWWWMVVVGGGWWHSLV